MPMDVSIPFSVAFLLLAVSLFISFLTNRRRSLLPPGPPPLPLLGNTLLTGPHVHRGLARLAEQYGPLMTFWHFTIPSIVISSPQLAEEVLRKQDSRCASRLCESRVVGHITRYKDIATATNNGSWKRERKLAMLHVASPRQVEAWRSVRSEEVGVMADAFAEAAASDVAGEGITLKPFLFRAALNNIMLVCAGRR